MRPITFTVPGTPKGQPRMKACLRGKRAGVYDPGTANDWKSAVYLFANQHKPDAPMDGPVRVDLTFIFPRPKRLMRRSDPDGHIPHTSKPDRDNLDKAVLDVLTNLGFWRDDAQVCAGEIRKVYGFKNDTGTGVQITISPIESAKAEKETQAA